MRPPNRKNKPQLRTVATLARILDAAEAIFSKQGFEKTQLEEVAAQAGYSRGAIYAHYAGKEDLFLALMEQRVLAKFTAIRQQLEAEPEVSKRRGIFKRWIATQVADQTWGTLILEFKLYALRRPHSRKKLQHMYDTMSKSSGPDFIALLFGAHLTKSTRVAIERRLAIMGDVLSVVNLESHLRPRLFPRPQMQAVFEDLFDALIHA